MNYKNTVEYIQEHLSDDPIIASMDKHIFEEFLNGEVPLDECMTRFCNRNKMEIEKIKPRHFKRWMRSLGFWRGFYEEEPEELFDEE